MKRHAVELLYPEMSAGGFTRFDHKIQFFSRINALLQGREGCVILDFGAGRGEWGDQRNPYHINLQDFRKHPAVKKTIGVDVDDAVLGNPYMDEKFVIDGNGKIPLPDNSVDFIVSYAVFEHIEHPDQIGAEFKRVLKPGGWVCAWTPNKLGYIAIASSLVPNAMHSQVLRKIGMVGDNSGQRGDADVFPTYYKLNTVALVCKHFPAKDFSNYSYIYSGPEGYAGRSLTLARILRFYNWVLPRFFGTHLYVFLQKRT